MANEARLGYGTFSLRADPEGVVHLDPVHLPETVAIGTDAWIEFRDEVWPLGGPHAILTQRGHASTLHISTPEGSFIYRFQAVERDTAGWYFVMRLVYTDSVYKAHQNGQG